MLGKVFRPRIALLGVAAAGVVLLVTTVAAGGASGPNRGPAATNGGVAPLAAGDERWVVCNGHLAAGTNCRVRGTAGGVLIARKLATGQYEAIFDINVRNCAYLATVGDFDASGTEPPGEITTVGRVTDVRGVFITTHNSGGGFEDRSWHLFVKC